MLTLIILRSITGKTRTKSLLLSCTHTELGLYFLFNLLERKKGSSVKKCKVNIIYDKYKVSNYFTVQ
jgi:hypothetical protein